MSKNKLGEGRRNEKVNSRRGNSIRKCPEVEYIEYIQRIERGCIRLDLDCKKLGRKAVKADKAERSRLHGQAIQGLVGHSQ